MQTFNRILCILLFFILPGLSFGQKVIEHEGDTLVCLSPAQIRTVNVIIKNWEIDKERIETLTDLVRVDSIRISQSDSLSQELRNLAGRYKIERNQVALDLQKTRRKMARRTGLFLTLTSILTGLLILK